MRHTNIEYAVNKDGTRGFSWNVITGCSQPGAVCQTRAKCWARGLHDRFWMKWGSLYNSDFSPHFNEHLLEEPFKLKKPSCILVSFMGDLFGPGMQWSWQDRILGRVWQLPQHDFLFLTKSPEALARLNPWPPNAWVGASATNKGELATRIYDLRNVEAKIKWISLEPLLNWTGYHANFVQGLSFINWLVLGKQTGPGAINPRLEWIEEISLAARSAGIPVWEKSNLAPILNRPWRQELPERRR